MESIVSLLARTSGEDREYDPNQVRVAWFEVVAARRRNDTLGAPARSRAAQRIWRRALRKLASELKLKVRFLTRLSIESLQWSEETCELNLPGARQCVQLSAECRREPDELYVR